MKLKQVAHDTTKQRRIALNHDGAWHLLPEDSSSLLELLTLADSDILARMTTQPLDHEIYTACMPFQPAAFRDFMLYEQHAIDAARGFVRKYMSHLLPIVMGYERLAGKPFPKLKPKKRYYEHPIYYMGNHLNFMTHNDTVRIPTYTAELDYELELAAVIIKPLKNASVDEVTDAIGGFLVLNDFSARDVQLDEMNSGFGPMKTKNFGSAISAEITPKSQLIDKIDALSVSVKINQQTVAENKTAGARYTLQEAIAYASWEEQLHPGELFASGTIPGCTGIENGTMLRTGDEITLEIEGIGQLTNRVQ